MKKPFIFFHSERGFKLNGSSTVCGAVAKSGGTRDAEEAGGIFFRPFWEGTVGILTQYFCREFLKLWALMQGIFMFLYLVIDFIEKIDNFLKSQVSHTSILLFFVYKTPLIAVQMAPAAALIAVIVMFSLMKKDNEITALKASGISAFRFSVPVLCMSMGLSAAVFLFSELVMPYASTKSRDIWLKEVKKHGQLRFYNRSNIWYRGEEAIYWIRHFDGRNMVMESPSFYFIDDSFRLSRKIDARRAIWTGNGWKAEEGIIIRMADNGAFEMERFKEMEIVLPEEPETFLKTDRRPEEMGYWELKRYAEKTADKGYDNSQYQVDLNEKLSFPLLSFIMALIGIPTALGLKKGGAALAVSVGIAAAFFYYLIHAFSRSLGLAGILPPALSAWLTSLCFLLIGSYLMIRMDT